MRLSHEVVKAEWVEDLNKWRLTVIGPDGQQFEDECNVFINGGGLIYPLTAFLDLLIM